MSERYSQEINNLREWFKQRLLSFGKFTLTEDEYKAGTDSLKGFHSDLVRSAFVEWLAIRRYELSYNQVCLAFFSTAKEAGLLQVTGQVGEP